MTRYIITWVTDAGDHYHEVTDDLDAFEAKYKEDENYYQQVHVFKISHLDMCEVSIAEHPCWEPGCEITTESKVAR